MIKNAFLLFLMGFFFLTPTLSVNYSNMERSKIPEKFKWDLSPLYKNISVWEKDYNAVKKEIAKIKDLKKNILKDPEHLYNFLQFKDKIERTLSKLYLFAHLSQDVDLTNSKNSELVGRVTFLFSTYSKEISFFKPLIARLSEKDFNKLLSYKPLKTYREYLTDIRRLKKHILCEKREKVIAAFSLISSDPETIYSKLNYADIKFPTVKLSNGEKVTINQSNYVKYRSSKNREDRKKVFEAFFKTLKQFGHTTAATLNEEIKLHFINAKLRNYKSCLEASLYPNNIDTTVYKNLVEVANENLDVLHRYMKLKKKIMGFKELRYYDLYADIIPGNYEFPAEEGKKIILKALKPLGEEYTTKLKDAFNSRWMDLYPNKGKAGGAYSDACYDAHPYVFLNYNDDYESLTTMAHEFGHAMHSFLSNSNQPFINSQYTTFVAEVASTMNETLLERYLVKNLKDKREKLFILLQYLEMLRNTFFRQTMFAEFELKIHELIEKGQPLSEEVLSKTYLNILKKYYETPDGDVKIDDIYGIEWAYIPHFYMNFYVYQYATSISASTVIAEKILKGEKNARENYLKMLKSGCSKPPVELLKMAGADLTTKKPEEKLIEVMSKTIDKVEKLWSELNK